jgi:FAD/FMN-containing dehydrogenase
MSYCEVQSMNALGQPGRRHRWKSNFLQEVSDDVIDTLITHFASVTSPQSVVLIEQIHGAVNRVGQDATAFSHRSARYNLTALSTWTDPSESERHSEWTREFSEAVQPLSTGGVYVNYMGQEGEERVKAAYAPATYEKLVALKNRYDPGNFFCLNQNIKPTA